MKRKKEEKNHWWGKFFLLYAAEKTLFSASYHFPFDFPFPKSATQLSPFIISSHLFVLWLDLPSNPLNASKLVMIIKFNYTSCETSIWFSSEKYKLKSFITFYVISNVRLIDVKHAKINTFVVLTPQEHEIKIRFSHKHKFTRKDACDSKCWIILCAKIFLN